MVDDDTTVTKYDCRVRVGDTQFVFGEKESNPPPPFYNLSAPLEDQPELNKEGKQTLTKGGEEKNEVRIYF